LQVRVAVAALLLCCGPAVDPDAPAEERPQAQRPNILLYVVDTLRADALAAYGNPVVETPNLDALARSGVVYPHARSVSSWTRASVASMLTGLYPEAHGAETRSDALSTELVVLPDLLSQHGYAVGAIVANPNLGSFYGFARGFDDFIELYERSIPGMVPSEELAATADVVTKRAIQWIDAAREPFFLFALSIDPHDPYEPPLGYDRYRAGYRGSADGTRRTYQRADLSDDDRARVRSLYWGEVAFTDAALGWLLRHLEERGLDDRTAVIFTSDHGEELWEHGRFGHGQTLFEESLWVPLIVRLAGGRLLDPQVGAPVEGVDLFPTILELAGIQLPAGTQGISLFAPATKRDTRAYASLRLDGRSLRALVRRPWKLVHDLSSGREWLYHLDRDPGETRDVSADFPEVANRLRLEMDAIADLASGRRPDAPQRVDEDLSARERALLEELGYVEPEGADPR
jgi:arylsulfatase A-like enzyme